MKLLVIDGNSILNRAFYGIRLLSNKNGVFTNAVTGFMNIYLKLLKEYSPDRVAVAFDLKAPTFRHNRFDGYKATRKGMPEELAVQLPYIKRLLPALGIRVVTMEGYEADDILGTLSKEAEKQGGEAIVSTGDRDSFQLVSDKTTVNLASIKGDIVYTPEKIMIDYGISPLQMIEVKSLMGDSSDNIPGVAGVGEKTAYTLIKKFGSLDGVYENINSSDISKSVRTKLENGKASAYMSRELAEIFLDVPIERSMDFYKIEGGDENEAAAILTELEMFAVMKKLDLKPVAVAPKKIEISSELNEKAEESVENSDFVPETDCCDIIFMGEKLFSCKNMKCDEISDIKAFLENGEKKRTFDVKSLWSFCFKNNIKPTNIIFDTTLAAYLLNVNSSEYSLERLCAEYNVPLGESGSELAECLFGLNSVLSAKLFEEGMTGVLTDIEIPLAEVLSFMEKEGIMLDCDGVRHFGERLVADICGLEEEIYSLAGKKFTIGSPKQLSVVLFEDLGLPSGKKTKTGYSTNAEVLEEIADAHPIVRKVLEYRQLSKLNSTYVDGLLKVVGEDGRVRSTFKQTETRTGRISSAEPNIQNIPVRTELGKNMRRFFTAKEGYLLVDADYSQIELRVLAHIADDKTMQEAFRTGEDIHTTTAAKVFNQPKEWIDADLRRKAKAVNFGIVYGIGAFSLSKDIGSSLKEAKEYIDEYLKNFSGVSSYMNETIKNAEKCGYTTTMFGRRRFIPEILATNKVVQALGKRIAMNSPIQGTAADIIKLAMVKAYRRLAKSGLDAKLILQVHDELIVEAREDVAPKVCEILREEMENAVKLSVPLTVDAESGKTWYDTH